MIRVSGLLFGGGGLPSGRSLPVETELTSPRSAQKLLTELLKSSLAQVGTALKGGTPTTGSTPQVVDMRGPPWSQMAEAPQICGHSRRHSSK